MPHPIPLARNSVANRSWMRAYFPTRYVGPKPQPAKRRPVTKGKVFSVIQACAAPLARGLLTVRAAQSDADMAALMALRGRVFRGDAGADDRDAFDPTAIHVLVEAEGRVMASGREIGRGYAAARYDLARLSRFAAPILELGRFCIDPQASLNPDVLRLAWAFITREVDARGAGMLCGCTSFPGRDPMRHRAALAHLTRHLAPDALAPLPRGGDAIAFARDLAAVVPDPVAALAGLPPLLRTYLMMGGWVSDHAVPDPDLDTLHVFTAVEIAAIPPARARALRALAG